MESLLRGRWTRWVLFLLGWAALSLLFAPEAYLSFYLRNAPISWLETVELTVINSAIALVFIPGIVFLTRRFPIERGRWQRSLAVHVVACLAFSVAHSFLYAVACHAWRDVGETLFVRFHPNLITYWAFVGFTQAFEYFRKYQQREREITRLQLQALKAQLQPHFLFNALNTVSAMMHVDVKRADRMLSRLSELLRMTLNNIERQEVRLAEEIAFVEAYLDIERERFGGRLAMRIDADPETLDALVPGLVPAAAGGKLRASRIRGARCRQPHRDSRPVAMATPPYTHRDRQRARIRCDAARRRRHRECAQAPGATL